MREYSTIQWKYSEYTIKIDIFVCLCLYGAIATLWWWLHEKQMLNKISGMTNIDKT